MITLCLWHTEFTWLNAAATITFAATTITLVSKISVATIQNWQPLDACSSAVTIKGAAFNQVNTVFESDLDLL